MRIENRRYLCYAILAGVVLFAPEATAQQGAQVSQDPDFWYRTIVAGLLSILIWIARGADTRLRNAEKQIISFQNLAVERGSALNNTTRRLELLEHEHKNTVSLVLGQRELLLTKYHDKEDTDRHRQKIEDTLDEQQRQLAKHFETLQAIVHRLDNIARPAHRSTDNVDR